MQSLADVRFAPESGQIRCVRFVPIPGFGAKLSAIILAGPTVLSAVGACPPRDGVRRRWWINVASAVSLRAGKKSGDLTTAIVPAGTSFSAVLREPLISLLLVTRQPPSSTS